MEFADGTRLAAGDFIGTLHFNNVRFTQLDGETSRRAALHFMRLMLESLQILANKARRDPAFSDLAVYHAVSWLPPHGQRVGFITQPFPDRAKKRLLAAYFRLLVWAFAPAEQTRASARPDPTIYWITRKELLARDSLTYTTMRKQKVTPSSPGASREAPEGNRVYLTFDDGPDAEWTACILDILAEANVRATFFVIGHPAREQAPLVRRIAAHGHAIGNHTWSHRHPWTMLPSAARQEVCDGAAAIADIIGQGARFFRPPHGRLRRCMIEEAESRGQKLVLWHRSAVDWGPLGRARGIAARLALVRAGDIVLMHDGCRGINHPGELVKVLPSFLTNLSRRGLMPSLLSDAAPSNPRR